MTLLGTEDKPENVKIAFSVLRVSRHDSAEAGLMGMLLSRDTAGLPGFSGSLVANLGAPLGQGPLLVASTLLAARPDVIPSDGTQPLVFMVFGRGRRLPILLPSDIKQENVKEIAGFLIGPCSCDVKGRIPGYDLLLSTEWDPLASDPPRTELPPVPALGQLVSARAALPGVARNEPAPENAPGPPLFYNLILAAGGAVLVVVVLTIWLLLRGTARV